MPLRSITTGTIIADRYEIIKLLGEGGMGAVYKARDRELDRLIALKVIRPELVGHPDVLQRFKQELILARQVTHKNVLRIFDLGITEGLKFITMEFIAGRDLSALMNERRLSRDEAIQVVVQVCHALDAAHSEGVVHRDLKPQNILISDKGRAYVMDFGLARSVESTGLTQTGAMLGTPAYMSPEQAMGQPADHRTDIFALGIILYELLTGVRPFEAETILGSLVRRTQGPPRAPIDVDSEIPDTLSAIVLRALVVDRHERYQTAAEMLADLHAFTGGADRSLLPSMISMPGVAIPGPPAAPRPSSKLPVTAAPPARSKRKWALVAIAAAAIVSAGVGAWLWLGTGQKPPATGKPVTIIVADFENATGDPIFTGTLEPMFTLALEGAKFVNSVRRDQALRIGVALQPGATMLTEPLARLVATREGIGVVVGGAIAKKGDEYKLAVRAVDAVSGWQMASRETTVSSREKVLAAVGKLAAPIRAALGDATPESAQLAAAETFTAASLEAAHSYAEAQNLRYAGKGEEAVKAYERAIQMDPNFGSAYGSLAAVHANLGNREKALDYYRQAMARTNRMSEREKFRTRGGYYLAALDSQKAIEELDALVKQYPADSMGVSALGFAYYLRRDMAKALEQGRRALEIYPKNVPYRNNVALYALYAGDFATAEKESKAALELNPAYLKGHVAQALALVGQGRIPDAIAAYQKLEKVSVLGASFAASGLADVALYEGRVADAVAILEAGIKADLDAKNNAAAAKKHVLLASARIMSGNKRAGLVSIERALTLDPKSVLFASARTLVEAGDTAKASTLAAQLASLVEPEPQAQSKLIQGAVLMSKGRNQEAIPILQESKKLADTWLVRFYLARAYLASGGLPAADSEVDACLRRRGESSDVFLDEQQTFHFLPPVYYYQGLVYQGLKSPGAAESFKTFLAIRSKGTPDAMVADAQRRLAAK